MIVVRGHEGLMDYPLDLSTVLPFAFAGLWVLDRHCVTPLYERVEEHMEALAKGACQWA